MVALDAISDDGVRKVQIVTSVVCSDARTTGILNAVAKDEVKKLYAEIGVDVIWQSVVNAGVYATKDIIAAVKRSIHRRLGILNDERETWELKREMPEEIKALGAVPVEAIVQVNTHADVSVRDGAGMRLDKLVYAPDELVITPKTGIHCGMEGADIAFEETMMLIIEMGPEVLLGGRMQRIDTKAKFLEMLWEYHAFDKNDPKLYIEAITNHFQHVARQAEKMGEALGQKKRMGECGPHQNGGDHQLENVDIRILHGIQNMRTAEIFRTDSQVDLYTPHDDYTALLADMLKKVHAEHQERMNRVAQQKPDAVMLSSPEVEHPRNRLAAYIKSFTSGSIFAIVGYDVVGGTYPFGPGRNTALGYAIRHLFPRDKPIRVYFVGENGDLMAMRKKLLCDPIADTLLKGNRVQRNFLTLSELDKPARDAFRGMPEAERNSLPPEYPWITEARREGLKAFAGKLHPRSPLRERLPPERLKRLQTHGY